MADETPWSRLRSEIYALIGRNPRSNRRMPSMAGLERSHRVLDVGCGPGAAVRAAAPLVASVAGVDRSASMIDIARRRSHGFSNVEYSVAAAEDLPFADAEFDRVWTIHSFHHWDDRKKGVAEARRVLGPGGRLLIVEGESKGSHGLTWAGANELAVELQASGFATATVTKPHRQLVVTGVVAE